MAVKSFFSSITAEGGCSPFLRRHLCFPLLGLVLSVLLAGCADPGSQMPIRYEWRTVRAGDWGSHLYDVHFISEHAGWAVGNAVDVAPGSDFGEGGESLIIHTADGGETWEQQRSGVFNIPLRTVHFSTDQIGWCAGEGGVLLRTTDAGETWNRIETGTESNLHDIFIGERRGWVVGEWGTLLRTTDAGETFTEVTAPELRKQSLRGVHFVGREQGWIVTQGAAGGGIYGTQDAGETWVLQHSADVALFDVHFVDSEQGWVVGDQRQIFVTTDGGRSWEFVTRGSNARHAGSYGQPSYFGRERLHTFTLYSVDFVESGQGWVVGDLGAVLHRSVDSKRGGGGITQTGWRHQRGGPRFHNSADGVLLGVDFISARLGWAVGENGTILHTRNGGVTWESQSSPSHLLVGVCAISGSEGYVVGDRGSILRTEDGGRVWRSQDSRTTECFGAAHFIFADVGWAVAEAGVVLHTTTGGSVWSPQNSGTEQDLLSVFFVDSETGWCVGSGGEIIHTADGGKTWERQRSGTSWNLFDVHFTSAHRGWAVGMNGTLLSTVDGGTQWKLASLSSRYPSFLLDAVTFVTPERGWVVGLDLRSLGKDGLILRTLDGGRTWERQESHTGNFLDDVFFISETEGWIVGKSGLVLHTTDAGVGWRPERTDTGTDLKSIYVNARGSGWAVGQNGTILSYEAVR